MKDRNIKPNVWAAVRVTIDDDALTLYVNEKEVLRCNVGGFSEPSLREGGAIGLVAHGSSARIRRWNVQPLSAAQAASPAPSSAGKSVGKTASTTPKRTPVRSPSGLHASPRSGIDGPSTSRNPSNTTAAAGEQSRFESGDMKMVEMIESDMIGDVGIKWDMIASLDAPKKLLKEAVVLPLLMPELFTGIREPWKGVCGSGIRVRWVRCCME